MKYFGAVFVFVVAFCGTTLASDEVCSDDELNKITTCYKAAYGDPVTLFGIQKALFFSEIKKAYWKPVCDDHQKLNECIGKDLLQKCFNIPSISKLPFPFVASGPYAGIVIATALQYDLICDEIAKATDENFECFEAQKEALIKECPRPDRSCPSASESLKCAVDHAYKCGKTVGCFAKKLTTLGLCAVDTVTCPNCDKISYSNNLIDGICES